MKEMKNEIYSLVDEEFISKFQENHAAFMQSYYYDYYCVVCGDLKRKPLSKQEFFHNMRRRRIQLYQLCCPYCGTIEVLIRDKKHEGKGSYNYCVTCGRGSAFSNMMNQVYRFSRISNVNRIGLKALKEKYPEKEDWLIGYDCYQMELIELASIIEVIFRDYFEQHMAVYDMLKGVEFGSINSVDMDKASIIYSVKVLNQRDKDNLLNKLTDSSISLNMYGRSYTPSVYINGDLLCITIDK